MIDKSKIKKSFSKSAKTYDLYSKIQVDISHKLIKKLSGYNINPIRGLDIGTGTGNCALFLCGHFSKSKIFAFDIANGMTSILKKKTLVENKKIYLSTADGSYIPYKNNTFELAISNLAYQWINPINSAFYEIKRILTTKGIFLFTILGNKTFKELRESYNHLKNKNNLSPLHNFPEKKKLAFYLHQAGFKNIEIEKNTIKKNYSDVKTFLKTLKYIGAKNAIVNSKHKGIGKKDSLNRLIDYYQNNFFNESGIYATYEVFLIIAS